jgi:ferric-dicitrate binding protein FerR (iron transport regulator)
MRLPVLLVAVLFPAIGFCTEEGSVLQTESAPREVHLDNGIDVLMASRSMGTLYGDRVVLERGAARVSHFDGYRVDAGQLHIEADTPGAEAVVRMHKSEIQVASTRGALKITDGAALVTRVTVGSKMSFQNSGASADQSASGAAPEKKPRSELKTYLWVIGGIAAAAIAIGFVATAQGKSPF